MSIKRLSDMSVKAKNVGGAGPRIDGRWAVVRGGLVTEVRNSDGTIDEIHTFTADGPLAVDSPGYAEVLLVSGGGGRAYSQPGGGGDIIRGLFSLPAGSHAVTIGAGGPDAGAGSLSTSYGRTSSIGSLLSTSFGGLILGKVTTPADLNAGVSLPITGAAVTYAAGATGGVTANSGNGGTVGSSGVVIVRVRKSP